jgi:predicted XRE-type DNA-binding protein
MLYPKYGCDQLLKFIRWKTLVNGAVLFPEEDAENKQSGSESGRVALPGFIEGARSMSKKRFANVWDAIEDTPAQAENMKLRSALIMALTDHIARTGLSQSEAAKLLGVTQPRISDLMRGKIELFGLDTLVNMIGAAGLHVEMRISDAA